MRKNFVYVVGLILFLSAPGLAYDPLAGGLGARPLSMGKAYTGLSDDSSGIFTNPAGLGDLAHPDFTSIFTQPQEGMTFTSLSAAFPRLGGVFGIALRNRSTSNIPVTGEVLADYIEQDITLLYAKEIRNNLSLGGNFRYISRSLSQTPAGFEGLNGSGTVLDLGLKFSPRPYLGIGFSLLALGGKISYQDQNQEEIASRTNLGLSFKAAGKNGYFDRIKQDWLLALDISKVADEQVSRINLGTEWSPNQYIALRFGVDQNPDPSAPASTLSNLNAGFGLKYRGIAFDYTYRKRGDPSQSTEHYFSLGYIGSAEIQPIPKTEPPPLPTPEAVMLRKVKRIRFIDLPQDHWAKEAAELLATAGAITGYADQTFRPNNKYWRENRFITRAEAAKILGIDREIKRPNDFITRAEYAALLYQTYQGKAAIRRLPPLED